MSDCRTMCRTFLREFIETYKELPCLWKVKSKEYFDKNKKEKAYKILMKKLQTVEPNASKTTVINKINSFRSGFRREYRKVVKSIKSGEKEVYVPSLWYYDLFLFVRHQNKLQEPNSSQPIQDNEDFFEEVDEIDELRNYADTKDEKTDNFDDIDWDQNESQNHLETDPFSPSTSASFSPSSNSKRLKIIKTPPDDQHHHLNVFDEEFTIIGKNIALKLRKLPKETKLYTEKLINDLLFQAELGNINKYTRIVTSDHYSNKTD